MTAATVVEAAMAVVVEISSMKVDIRMVAAVVAIKAAMVFMASLLEQRLLEVRETMATPSSAEVAEVDSISVAEVMALINSGNIKSLKEVKLKINESFATF